MAQSCFFFKHVPVNITSQNANNQYNIIDENIK